MNLNEIRDMLEDKAIKNMAIEYATACGEAAQRAVFRCKQNEYIPAACVQDRCCRMAVAHAVAEGANFFYRCAMGEIKRNQSQKQNRKRGKSVKEQLAGAA